MSITGIILWWPLNGKISRGLRFTWSAPWKKLIFSIHRAVGIYASLFLLIVAVTGTSLVFNKSVAEIANFLTGSPPRPVPPLSDSSKAQQIPLSLDDLLEKADSFLPAPTTWVSFPQTRDAPLVVRKKMPEEFHPNGRSFIYLDQYTGELLSIENASAAPVGTRIYNTFYPIHVGIMGGLTTQVLQVMIGFLPLVLFVTGYIMWRNRRKVKACKNGNRPVSRN